MKVELVGLAVVACVLVGHGIVYSASPTQPLRYKAEFGAGDGEFAEVLAFLREVDAACERGDVAGLVRRLTLAHGTALRRRLRHVGRALSASTLREMKTVVPLPDEPGRAFVLGRRRGARVVVVMVHHELDFRARPAAVCLTSLPLLWDGRTFHLARPRLRQVAENAVTEVAAALAESWLSAETEGMNSTSIPSETWQTTAPR